MLHQKGYEFGLHVCSIIAMKIKWDQNDIYITNISQFFISSFIQPQMHEADLIMFLIKLQMMSKIQSRTSITRNALKRASKVKIVVDFFTMPMMIPRCASY